MSSFALSKTETDAYLRWDHDHLAQAHGGMDPDTSAIGGRVTFEFTGTSLGLIIKVRCACGAKQDITDYDHMVTL